MKHRIIILLLVLVALATDRLACASGEPYKIEVTREIIVDDIALPEFQAVTRLQREQRQRMVEMEQERAESLPGLKYRRQKIEKKMVRVTIRNDKIIKTVVKRSRPYDVNYNFDPPVYAQGDSLVPRKALNFDEQMKEERKVEDVKSTSQSTINIVRAVRKSSHYLPKGKIKVTVSTKPKK